MAYWLPAPAGAEDSEATGRLSGRVRSAEGKPLAGAVVAIVNATNLCAAGPVGRGQPPTKVPPHWCSADCGKHTVTADDGSFTLEGLAANMQFTVRAERTGSRT